MARTPKDITDAELAVLETLWSGGAATIRQLTDLLYPGGGTSSYATVQKLLERLEEKGTVRRDRRRLPHVFQASVERSDLIGKRLRDVADQLCGGSLTPLLTHLVKQGELSRGERQALRDLVEELDANKPQDEGPAS